MTRKGCGRYARQPGQPWDELFAPMSLAEARARFDFKNNPRKPLLRDKLSDWYRFCQMDNYIFEYSTREYIEKMGGYLAERCTEITTRCAQPARILEVAAGQGRLAFLLTRALGELGVEHSMTAADNFDGPFSRIHPSWAEELDYKEAIVRDRPHIIIASWIYGGSQRWTA